MSPYPEPRADWIDPLDDLRLRFLYRSEVKDRWSVLTAPEGPLEGDCDDFAVTAAWILSGQSWRRLLWNIATLRMVLWSVKTPWGAGHVALWVRGKGWICNINKDFGPLRFGLRLPYILPLFLIAALVKGLRRA
jgi:hypothetical protein